MERYQGEPYVLAGDVCAHPEHAGRAGWTWYTGSAGWMYRAGLESILGLRRHGATFELDPCIPASWPEYAITWRVGRTRYEIAGHQPGAPSAAGSPRRSWTASRSIPAPSPLGDDGGTHQVRVVLGGGRPPPAGS